MPCQSYLRILKHVWQCCGSMTFWGGSGSGSADPCLRLMDPDPAIFVSDLQDASKKPWMKEEGDNTSREEGYLRCPASTSVHFSLRNEGSSEYIRFCEGRENLSPNFQTFQDPGHQFHGINRLVSETLYLLATLALLHMQSELIHWKFLHFLKV